MSMEPMSTTKSLVLPIQLRRQQEVEGCAGEGGLAQRIVLVARVPQFRGWGLLLLHFATLALILSK